MDLAKLHKKLKLPGRILTTTMPDAPVGLFIPLGSTRTEIEKNLTALAEQGMAPTVKPKRL